MMRLAVVLLTVAQLLLSPGLAQPELSTVEVAVDYVQDGDEITADLTDYDSFAPNDTLEYYEEDWQSDASNETFTDEVWAAANETDVEFDELDDSYLEMEGYESGFGDWNSTDDDGRRELRAGQLASAWNKEYFTKWYKWWRADPFTANAYKLQLSALTGWTHNGKITSYAGAWDERVYGAGSDAYWMGLKRGGCGYADIRKRGQYPHMNAVGITLSLRDALGMNNFQHGIGCGACIKFKCTDRYYCPKGTTSAVAMVTDLCPSGAGCEHGLQGDVFRGTFLIGTGNSPSNPRGQFQRVTCPDPQRPIHACVGVNWGPYLYLKVMFRDIAGYGVITKVDYVCCNGRMGVVKGNKYICSNGKSPQRANLIRANGAYWQTGRGNSPAAGFCQFEIWQEDGTKRVTKLGSRLSRGSADYNNGRWVGGKCFNTKTQFYQSIREKRGKWVVTQGLGRRPPGRGRGLLGRMNITALSEEVAMDLS